MMDIHDMIARDAQLDRLARTIVFRCLGSLGSNTQYIEAVHTLLAKHLGSQISDSQTKEMQGKIDILRGLIVEAWGVLTDKELVEYDPWEGYVDDLIARLDVAGRPDEDLASTEQKL